MATVRTTANHPTTTTTYTEINSGDVISDGAARAVAAWWRAATVPGRVLARLSSGLPTDVDELVADCEAKIDEARGGPADQLAMAEREMGALIRWAEANAAA
jgi:hypothetical protein